jgi:WD40 repeat protein
MSDALRSPYPGLRPFEADEADLFFGREQHVDALLKRLSGSHFVAVVGESGAGKSSLVRAGLLPALQAGFVVEAGSDWRVAVMRPGGAPLAALADALLQPGVLTESGGLPHAEFALAELRRGPLGLVQVVRDAYLGSYCNLLVVVDQFEEVFRYCREPAQKDQADIFVELILRAADQREVPIFVVLTMRSDFVGDCARFRGLPETLNDNQYLTPRLTRDQIGAAIREPARVCGGVVDPALVDELCNAVGDNPDQLPLLQHLLMRVWDRASERSTPPRLTGDLAVMMGGLYSALNHHAQLVYDSLREEQKTIGRAMFKRLTDPLSQRRDLRRDALVSDIAAVANVDVADVIAVADAFRAPGRHMLMPPPEIPLDAESRLDISHESLIRQWITLNQWAREENVNAREFQRLRDEAREEVDGQADLLTGRDLARALDWMKQVEPTPAWAARYSLPGELETTLEFINRSGTEAQRRKDEQKQLVAREVAAKRALRYRWASAVVLVLAAIVVAVISNLWLKADEQRLKAEEQTREAQHQESMAKFQEGEASRQRELAENAKEKAILNGIKADEQRNLAVAEGQEAAEARAQAHARQLVADARVEGQNDPALAVLLARAAVREPKSDEQALDALRRALAGHVPNIESHFDVAKSRHFVPGSTKREWLDFALNDASVSPREAVAVVPSGNEAIVWSLASPQPKMHLRGHTGIVGGARFSPDGTLIATSSQDKTARLWDATTGQSIGVLEGHKGMLNDVAFSPDGKLVITLGDDERAKIWTVGSDSKLLCELITSSGNFLTASFSDDRKRLLTVIHDGNQDWNARVWNIAAGNCPDKPERMFASATGLKWASFSPYGPWLGIVRTDGEVAILNTSAPNATDWSETTKIAAVRRAAPGDDEASYLQDQLGQRIDYPPALAWSADGRYFAAAGVDHIVRVMAISGTSEPVQLRGHTEHITSLSFHPSANILLSTSADESARLWKLGVNGRLIDVLVLRGHKDRVGSGVFASGGSTIMTAGDDRKVRVWQPRWTLIERPLAGVASAGFTPDGRRVWAAGTTMEKGVASAWTSEFDSGTVTALKNPSTLPARPGQSAATYVLDRSSTGELTVRNIRDAGPATTLAESRMVAPIRSRITTLENRITSPDGRFLLVGANATRVWDLASPERPPDRVSAPSCRAGAISSDKRIAWYCPEEDRIMITRVGRTSSVTIPITDRVIATAMQFSPSGRWVAVNFDDRSVRLIDTNTRKTALILRGHDEPHLRLVFSPDNRLLLGIGQIRSRVWGLPGGEPIAVLPPAIRGAMMETAVFNRDGRSLAFTSPGRLLVWQCEACGGRDALLAEADRRQIARTLTPEESLRFGLNARGVAASHDHADAHVRPTVQPAPMATPTTGSKPH